MSQQNGGERSALLHPLKDFAKNWDIDIASGLVDYLEELSGLTFEVDGHGSLDFIEAARVIENGSYSYTKKVDYLMQLSLAAQESARAKRQENQQAGRKRKGQAAQPDDVFQTVDDLIADIAAAGCDDYSIDPESLALLEAPEPQPALLVDVLQSTPNPTVAHLVGPERKDMPQRAAQQSRAANMSPSDAPTFNMMRCHWHCSGILLLAAADGQRYDWRLDTAEIARASAPAGPAIAADMLLSDDYAENAPPQHELPDPAHPAAFGSPMPALPGCELAEQDAAHDPLASPGAVPEDAAADAGPSGAEPAWFGPDNGDDWGDAPMPEQDVPTSSPNATPAAAEHQADAQIGSARTRRTQRPSAELADAPRPAADPYQELDAHSTASNVVKLYKQKVPKTPKCVTTVKQVRWRPFAQPDFLAVAQQRMRLLLPAGGEAAAATGPANKGKTGSRASRAGKSAARRSVLNAGPLAQPGPAFDAEDPQRADAELAQDGTEARGSGEPGGGHLDGHAGAGEGWMVMDFGADAGDDGGAAGPSGFEFDDVADDEPVQAFSFDVGDLQDFDSFGKGFGSQLEGSQLAGSSAYEELVAQYSQAVAAAATNAASQSSLARKVSSWRAAISEVMVEQDRRPEFDVQETGRQMLQHAAAATDASKDTVTFGQLAECTQRYQVARCFSAFLQQVNAGTVELVDAPDGDEQPFYVRVLEAAA